MSDRFRVALSVLIAVGLCACATSDEPRSRGEPAEQPATGRVDVGGYELAWMCRGSGSPTIIAEAGYDSAGTDTWFDLLAPLSKVSRVCTYDRAGTGTSDDRPTGMDVTGMLEAEELHRLPEGAGIEPPYVVMSHSYGGFVSRLFVARYRGEVAGLVLVDSSHEDEIEPYRRFYGDSPEGDWVDGGDLVDIDATAQALRRIARDFDDLPPRRGQGGTVRGRAYGSALGPYAGRSGDAVIERRVRAGSRWSLRHGRRPGSAPCGRAGRGRECPFP